MYKEKTFLAVIPARIGSKRLAKKNILDLSGKPLVAWTIESAVKSKYLDEVVVSTDSEDVALVAKKYGAKVPFLRPLEFSTDTASTYSVAKHCIDFYDKELRKKFDYIILLQPTSPLRKHNEIDNAIEYLIKKQADAVISVTEVDHSPMWVNTLPSSLSMKNFTNEKKLNNRSQDIEKFYRPNGSIYIVDMKMLKKYESFYIKENIYAYIMDRMTSIDIDDLIDFKLVEVLVDEFGL